MGEVDEHLQPVGDDRVRGAAVHVGHEADAAGLVFKPGIIKPLLGRHPVSSHVWSIHRNLFRGFPSSTLAVIR